eukprot:15354398-Ditylum_brightwellii.AAC.1
MPLPPSHMCQLHLQQIVGENPLQLHCHSFETWTKITASVCSDKSVSVSQYYVLLPAALLYDEVIDNCDPCFLLFGTWELKKMLQMQQMQQTLSFFSFHCLPICEPEPDLGSDDDCFSPQELESAHIFPSPPP